MLEGILTFDYCILQSVVPIITVGNVSLGCFCNNVFPVMSSERVSFPFSSRCAAVSQLWSEEVDKVSKIRRPDDHESWFHITLITKSSQNNLRNAINVE